MDLKKLLVLLLKPPEGNYLVADVLGDSLSVLRPTVINRPYGQQAQGYLDLPLS